jgi:hypothetical protein
MNPPGICQDKYFCGCLFWGKKKPQALTCGVECVIQMLLIASTSRRRGN